MAVTEWYYVPILRLAQTSEEEGEGLHGDQYIEGFFIGRGNANEFVVDSQPDLELGLQWPLWVMEDK